MVEQGDTPAFKPELNGHRGAAIPVGGEKLFQRSWCRHPDLCFLIGGGLLKLPILQYTPTTLVVICVFLLRHEFFVLTTASQAIHWQARLQVIWWLLPCIEVPKWHDWLALKCLRQMKLRLSM